MGYEKTKESIQGFNWINDGKNQIFVRIDNPCIYVDYREMSFLKEGCCPGCGKKLENIVQNNNIAAFDTVYSINSLSGEISCFNKEEKTMSAKIGE